MTKQIGCAFILMILICSCSIPIQKEQNIETIPDSENWKVEVEKTLKSFGHRNWIVVADAAYPQQSNQSIKTLTVDANQLEVVAIVNGLIEKSTHVSANLFLDKEMAFVTEQSAKGIEAYSAGLDKILGGKPKTQLFHEDIIQELDESAKLFNVLIIKTDLAIPYTSVFFQLECGYWNAEAEESLRAVINKK